MIIICNLASVHVISQKFQILIPSVYSVHIFKKYKNFANKCQLCGMMHSGLVAKPLGYPEFNL